MYAAVDMLGELASWSAERFGDRTFLECWSSTDGVCERLSFADFAERERHARELLASLGAKHGLRVAMLSHACPDSLALTLASAALGCVVVNLNWRQPASMLLALTQGLGCELLVAGRSFAETARTLCCDAVVPPHRLLLLDHSELEL